MSPRLVQEVGRWEEGWGCWCDWWKVGGSYEKGWLYNGLVMRCSENYTGMKNSFQRCYMYLGSKVFFTLSYERVQRAKRATPCYSYLKKGPTRHHTTRSVSNP